MPQSSYPAPLLLAVAIGSALGGVARLLLSTAVQERWSPTFPLGTLVVNAVGCFALGFIVHLADETTAFSHTSRAFLTIGFCGGFTTFSAFAGETMRAAEDGAYGRASLNVGLSLLTGMAGIWIGAITARVVLGLLRRGG